MKILNYPHKILSTKTEPVTEFNEELKELANNMLKTMEDAKGIGLAANQVGINKQIFVTNLGPHRVYVNPILMYVDDELENVLEGCLSVPGGVSKVTRRKRLICEAKDVEGNNISVLAEGLLAQMIQHEIDHIYGELYIDHLSRIKRDLVLKAMQKHCRALIELK